MKDTNAPSSSNALVENSCCYDASTECTETTDNDDYEMQIVEELHLACRLGGALVAGDVLAFSQVGALVCAFTALEFFLCWCWHWRPAWRMYG